ncbi:DUF7225 domain-containing protein [Jeotgalibacillus terrae]|uniref:DUF6998 domain-containing protein n=1 Tax=Jeotgalibacillus terrae TaxID=587735 RepID=A0ABW5ZBT1_9BACL|nr:hypothetical protein [Jeotgalibacillus terrae]MBM7577845.1 hypothetical protein [Jeotgalibacillus terrae]
MKIYDQLVEVMSGRVNDFVSRAEVQHQLFMKFGTNPESVILSDYCYNRFNKGIRFDKHLFIYINKSTYKFVGEHHRYTGLIFHRAKSTVEEKIVGEWKNGEKVMYEESANHQLGNISREQIEKLFEEYQEILRNEMSLFNCRATELRHLIGRIGEFYCALHTGGNLAREVNQHGFDVESGGRRISVKATAQNEGFVTINTRTFGDFDDFFVVQYINDDFKILYYGPKEEILSVARVYEGKYEVDLKKLEKIGVAN